MYNYKYHGFWFYHLATDEIVQAKDLAEEYCILNCPQEYEGPFKTKLNACRYRAEHPDEHKKFIQSLKDMEEFYYGEN